MVPADHTAGSAAGDGPEVKAGAVRKVICARAGRETGYPVKKL